MKIEKICEYLNDIGILQFENINKFLKIYTQLSQEKYKNTSDKLILALFSYITQISKNEQQLYQTCKNMVQNISNNQILYRYRALNMLNNIFKYKLQSKYIFFFCKLNYFILNRSSKYKYSDLYLNSKNNYSNSKTNEINEFLNEKEYINNTSIDKNVNDNNKLRINPKIKNRITKRNIKRKDNINNNTNTEKNCTFFPNINHNYKRNSRVKKINLNNNFENLLKNINYESGFYSSYNNMGNFNDYSFNRNIPFKSSNKYGYNNKINNEIEKLLQNISKYSNNPNNSKYFPQKTICRKQIKNLYKNNSVQDIPFSNISNNNDFNYIDENYDFYQNEKDHLRKVQDKILQLKLTKMDEMFKECTFTPEINNNSKYINMNQINNSTVLNLSHRNYYSHINNTNNNFNNRYNYNTINSKKTTSNKRNDKIYAEYEDDYYNIYPRKLEKPHSYSGSKNISNEYSIYRERKTELSKLFDEKYPFKPNIKYNKYFPIKSTFDERQKKFIKNKEKLNKLKEEEKLKEIEELRKRELNSKTNSKEVIKRLYDNEAIKIKDRLKKEREEKSKKKSIIDWNKRKKQYKERYPQDFNNKTFQKNLKLNDSNNINKKEENSFDYNVSTIKVNKNNLDDYNEKINSNKDYININRQLLMNKIKDEHIIGFKNNNSSNISINNSNILYKNFNNDCKTEDSQIKSIKENSKQSIKDSKYKNNRINNEMNDFNLEEKMKNF